MSFPCYLYTERYITFDILVTLIPDLCLRNKDFISKYIDDTGLDSSETVLQCEKPVSQNCRLI